VNTTSRARAFTMRWCTRAPVVYDYTYYDGGYYNGPYWYYRDRDGHVYHEMREEHERRERERHTANFRETRPPMGVDRRSAGTIHGREGGQVQGHDRDDRDRDRH
jgi:hypothetical protein